MVAAVLSGRKIAFLDGAGIPKATIAFKEQLCAFPPAQSAFRIAISSQFLSPSYMQSILIFDSQFSISDSMWL
jgi:hypothetical protein